MNWNRIFVTCCIVCTMFVSKAFAQYDDDYKSQIEALRIAFFTKEMKLSPAEAKVFWPVFQQFKEEESMLRKQHPLHRTTGQVDLHMLTEAQASTMLTEIVLYEKRINALSENYIPEFRKILSDKKIVLMYAAEKKFRKELLMRAKEQRSGIKP